MGIKRNPASPRDAQHRPAKGSGSYRRQRVVVDYDGYYFEAELEQPASGSRKKEGPSS